MPAANGVNRESLSVIVKDRLATAASRSMPPALTLAAGNLGFLRASVSR